MKFRSQSLLFALLLITMSCRAQLTPNTNPTNSADARVVIAQDPGATENLQPVPAKVQSLVNRSLMQLTGKTNLTAAWQSLVAPSDVVGLKVLTTTGPNSGTRKDVVAAVIQGLLGAGIPATNIIVWDRYLLDLRLAGYFELERRFGVKVLGSVEAGYDEKAFYETPLIGTLVFGDLEYGKKESGVGRKSYVSKLVTRQMTKIINITPLLHHNMVGVSGNLFSLALGSVDNNARFETSVEEMSRAIPEIYALPTLGDRVVLNIVDALICQYEGQQQGLLHYSAILNEIRVSRDPLALDVLSFQEITHQRELAGVPYAKTNLDIFANAALLEIGISDLRHIKIEKLP